MATNFPGSDDVFTEPGSPGSTALSSSGTGSRNHTQHHRDLGDAIEAMQAEATLLAHSHNGSTARHGSKLSQANTHQSPDTDSSTSALHHTIGSGANQAAAGNHTHTQSTSHGSPDTDSSTSSLHHTIGTGANQAAAGNHQHGHESRVYFTSSGTFTKATYPGLYAVEVEVVGGGGGSRGVVTVDSGTWGFGGGGAGGGYARAYILAASLASNVTVTIGSGGAGGAPTSPGNGGTTSFGPHVSATGGEAGGGGFFLTTTAGSGWGNKTGGAPGGTYDIGLRGNDTGPINFEGGPVFSDSSGLSGYPSGGPYGSKNQENRGSSTGSFGTMSASAGLGYGSGARGVISNTSTSQQNGAAGSAGICVVRLIF